MEISLAKSGDVSIWFALFRLFDFWLGINGPSAPRFPCFTEPRYRVSSFLSFLLTTTWRLPASTPGYECRSTEQPNMPVPDASIGKPLHCIRFRPHTNHRPPATISRTITAYTLPSGP